MHKRWHVMCAVLFGGLALLCWWCARAAVMLMGREACHPFGLQSVLSTGCRTPALHGDIEKGMHECTGMVGCSGCALERPPAWVLQGPSVHCTAGQASLVLAVRQFFREFLECMLMFAFCCVDCERQQLVMYSKGFQMVPDYVTYFIQSLVCTWHLGLAQL
jgi:hypothetical protein